MLPDKEKLFCIKPEEAEDFVKTAILENCDPDDHSIEIGIVRVYYYPDDGKFEVIDSESLTDGPHVEVAKGYNYVLCRFVGFPLVGSMVEETWLLEQIYIDCAIGLLKDAKCKEIEEVKAQLAKLNDELSGLNRL